MMTFSMMSSAFSFFQGLSTNFPDFLRFIHKTWNMFVMQCDVSRFTMTVGTLYKPQKLTYGSRLNKAHKQFKSFHHLLHNHAEGDPANQVITATVAEEDRKLLFIAHCMWQIRLEKHPLASECRNHWRMSWRYKT